jgi:hypothetical protein
MRDRLNRLLVPDDDDSCGRGAANLCLACARARARVFGLRASDVYARTRARARARFFSRALKSGHFFLVNRLARRCGVVGFHFHVKSKLVCWMMVLWMRGSVRELGFRGRGFC